MEKVEKNQRIVCSQPTKLKFDNFQSEIGLIKNEKVDQDAALDFLLDFFKINKQEVIKK